MHALSVVEGRAAVCEVDGAAEVARSVGLSLILSSLEQRSVVFYNPPTLRA